MRAPIAKSNLIQHNEDCLLMIRRNRFNNVTLTSKTENMSLDFLFKNSLRKLWIIESNDKRVPNCCLPQ